MKLKKQIIVIFIIILFFTSFDIIAYNAFTKNYINHTNNMMQAKSIELDKYLPFKTDSKIVKYDASLKLYDNLPTLDGAAALYPVFSAFVNAVYPETSVSFNGSEFTDDSKLHFSNTKGAYKAVVDGDADIIFCAKPSEEQLEYAENNNVKLEMIPIGHEAFVFIVNKNNPVDNLSVEQVKKIYSGEYTKWSQVGGNNKFIDNIQRNEGSGSQTAMLSFMNGTKMKRNILGICGSAIGYSFRYYVEDIVANRNIKILSLNGVYPDKKTIADKSYPIVGELYAVYNKANDNENIPILINWILSSEGQSVIEQSGYIPLN